MPTTDYIWEVVNDTVLMEKDGGGNTTAVYHSDPVPYGRLFSMRRGGKTYNYRYLCKRQHCCPDRGALCETDAPVHRRAVNRPALVSAGSASLRRR